MSFYITSGRSGVDVYKIINQLGNDVIYIHDKGPWYNVLDWQGIPNRHGKIREKKRGRTNIQGCKAQASKHGQTLPSKINRRNNNTVDENILHNIQ